jgi:ankyrin repeat protein
MLKGVSTKQIIPQRVVDEVDQMGRSALFRAAANGDVEQVMALLDRMTSAQIGHQNYYLNTPLSVAAARGHMDIVRLLLAKMSVQQILLTNKLELNAEGMATMFHHDDIAAVIRDTMPQQSKSAG